MNEISILLHLSLLEAMPISFSFVQIIFDTKDNIFKLQNGQRS